MNTYNLLLYVYKMYTLYNNVYYNYNLYILSLFLNPCITYFLKQRSKKTNTLIYTFVNINNTKYKDEDEIKIKLLQNNKEKDDFKIEILNDEEKDLENFVMIEKLEK